MAGQQRQKPPATVDATTRQEGSRWIGDPPTGDQVAAWFKDNVHLHDGMDPTPYLPGITLITSTEKVKRLVGGAITDVERLVHVPYAKVETRVAYFWDLCRKNDWLGVIEPVNVPRVGYQNMLNEHLPPGFFRVPVALREGILIHYIACSMKVTIYKPDIRAGGRGRVILDAPPATKQIAMVNKFNESDQFAMMKAETGAVGRALGMAGMLALPGSGVATAEDMLEALSGDRPGASSEPPPVVAAAEQQDDAGDRQAGLIAELSSRLESEAPGKVDEIKEWAEGRGIDLNDIKPTQRRAVIAQLEKALR